LILREERKLRVFENMVLRRTFGSRRDEVTGEWRRLHNEELNDLAQDRTETGRYTLVSAVMNLRVP